MEQAKLKLKIGEHEFEAEGPAEIVQAQLAAFRELVAATPPPRQQPASATSESPKAPTNELQLDKIMRHDDRVVSLTARAGTLEEEILLVMLGQRQFRQNDSVTGAEIINGLRQTGQTISRLDYQLSRMADGGLLITTGVRRARRYRLTNQGFAQAQEIAMRLAEQLP